MPIPRVTEEQREAHLDWLKDLTNVPTAAGREDRVIAWVESWVNHRARLRLDRDKVGNLIITPEGFPGERRPLYITAHLDHPAFIVRSVNDDVIELDFRGGVQDPYFVGAKIEIFDSKDRKHLAVIENLNSKRVPFKGVTARLTRPRKGLIPGDMGRWALPSATVTKGLLHAPACDDLAAVVAALGAIDIAFRRKGFEHLGVLLTRAEEVGFLGATAACKHRSITKNARLICLENSRSFAESPIGGGPILRVGDRISVFEPAITNQLTAIMLDYAKRYPDFRWQRKLMPGGACEATTFASFGFESTCVCLPLGNYHNMKDVDATLAGKKEAKIAREFISVDDFHGLVQMLLICAGEIDHPKYEPIRTRMERLYAQRANQVLAI